MFNWVTDTIKQGAVRIDHIIFYGFHEPKPLEKAFIQAIAGIASEVHYYVPYVRGCKAFFDEVRLAFQHVEELKCSEEDVAIVSLFSPSSRKRIEKLARGVFRDPLDEMRAVAREIRSLISSGVEPGHIAIMLPIRSKAAPLVGEVLDDYGIPYNLHLKTSLSESPVVMSILSILEAVDSEYDRDAVIRMISSPYFTFRFSNNGHEHALQARDVGEVSLLAGILGGKDTWSSSL
jgi:hypothetical protein